MKGVSTLWNSILKTSYSLRAVLGWSGGLEETSNGATGPAGWSRGRSRFKGLLAASLAGTSSATVRPRRMIVLTPMLRWLSSCRPASLCARTQLIRTRSPASLDLQPSSLGDQLTRFCSSATTQANTVETEQTALIPIRARPPTSWSLLQRRARVDSLFSATSGVATTEPERPARCSIHPWIFVVTLWRFASSLDSTFVLLCGLWHCIVRFPVEYINQSVRGDSLPWLKNKSLKNDFLFPFKSKCNRFQMVGMVIWILKLWIFSRQIFSRIGFGWGWCKKRVKWRLKIL